MTYERITVNKREDFKRFIVFCLASIVVIAQTAVFAYIWYDYYRELIFEPFWRKGNWVLIAIYALINVLFSRLYGGLKVGYLKRIDVFYSMTLATLCTNIVTYFQITLINRWFLRPWPMVEMTIVQFVIILLWIWGSRYIYSKLYRARKLLVIYGDRDPGDLIQKMNSRRDKYDISGKIHISVGEREIYRRMKEYDGVIIWDLPSGIRNQYLKHCFAHSIRCYLSPKISDVILMGSERIHLFDTPLLVAKNMGLSVEQRIMKRLLDIVVSGLGIIVASPLMLIIAACVKLYDGGPVFYLQERLINVFKGEMSLVGPRPERQTLVHEYCREIPEFYYRLKVKAGLTGYAQVYGKYNTTPYDKLKLDLFYIENYSFFLDLKLLLMTVKIFFQKEVSEGVNDNQTNALKDSAESIDVTEDKSTEK